MLNNGIGIVAVVIQHCDDMLLREPASSRVCVAENGRMWPGTSPTMPYCHGDLGVCGSAVKRNFAGFAG